MRDFFTERKDVEDKKLMPNDYIAIESTNQKTMADTKHNTLREISEKATPKKLEKIVKIKKKKYKPQLYEIKAKNFHEFPTFDMSKDESFPDNETSKEIVDGALNMTNE